MLNNFKALRRLSKNPLMINNRSIHSIAQSGAEVTQNETPVTVYQSEEFEGFNNLSSSSDGEISTWDNKILHSELKSKFFSLIPFQIESVSHFYSFYPDLEIHKEIFCFEDGSLPRVKVLETSYSQAQWCPPGIHADL